MDELHNALPIACKSRYSCSIPRKGLCMDLRRLFWLAVLLVCAPAMAVAGSAKKCVSADEATKMVNKDVCVSAHIYDVVELPDGTRFLDVCTPQTPDDKCRFTMVSLAGRSR